MDLPLDLPSFVLAEDATHRIGVWDIQTRQHKCSFGVAEERPPTPELWCLQFSPQGDRLLSASNDYQVKIWPWDSESLQDVKTPLRKLPVVIMTGQCNRASFSHDGKRIVAGGEEFTVQICDAFHGDAPLRTLRGHTGDVFALAASRDGRWLASGGQDTTIRLWDAESGEAKYKLRGHVGAISSLAFSPDNRLLASGCRDNTVKVWELDRIVARDARLNVGAKQRDNVH